MSEPRPALTNQQRRTRTALSQAAARLLGQGVTPTVAQVADEALVSRRTAYRYFPTADQLLADAALELTTGDITSSITTDDPVKRVDQFVAAINRMTADQESALRTLVRTTLDSPRDPDGPRRGMRRMAWIEEIIEPLRVRLPAAEFKRVAAALALTVGIEARLSLVDVAGLSDREADRVSRWVAELIVRSALDAGTKPGGQRAKRG